MTGWSLRNQEQISGLLSAWENILSLENPGSAACQFSMKKQAAIRPPPDSKAREITVPGKHGICSSDATLVLQFIAEHPFEHLDVTWEQFRKIEGLIFLMWDKNSPHDSINESRKELFCRRNRAMGQLLLTQVRIYLVEKPYSAAVLFARITQSLRKHLFPSARLAI